MGGLPRSNTWDGPDRPEEAMHKGEDTEDSFFGASWLSLHVAFWSFLTCAVARFCLSAMSPANDMGVQASSGLLYVGMMALVATGLDLSCGITGIAVVWHLRGDTSFSTAKPDRKKCIEDCDAMGFRTSKHGRMQKEAELVFRTLSLFLSLALSLSVGYSWRGLLTLSGLLHYAGVTAGINAFARVVASRVVAAMTVSTRAGMTLVVRQ